MDNTAPNREDSSPRKPYVTRHTELDVYRRAFEAAMELFELSKSFPKEEMYSLTDQIRRASRSACGNLAEAWRRRRYEAAFVAKLNEVESEAAETQVWIEFAVRCSYVERDTGARLFQEYEAILAMVVTMIQNASDWTL